MDKDKKQMPADVQEVGWIAGAHGIKGGLHIAAYSADAEAFYTAKKWYLLPADHQIKAANTQLKPNLHAPQGHLPRNLQQREAKPEQKVQIPTILTIKNIQPHQKGLVITAQEVEDRNLAEALKGMRIFISRADFPKLTKEEYYWVDLIGLNVLNLQGGMLGKVEGLITNGVQDILKIAYPSVDKENNPVEAERLIPYIDVFVKQVDLEEKTITVDWQEDY